MARTRTTTTKPTGDSTATRWVRFDTPGVQRIGDFLPGRAYELPAAEAERLVKRKGFRYTTSPAAPAQTEG